jgi:hypothetical protein
MKIDIRIMTISCMVFFFNIASAHSTIVTSSSDPALDGAFVEDFSSTAAGAYDSLQVDGITYTAPSSVVDISSYDAGSYNTTGNSLSNDSGNAPQVVFNFAAPQAIFGFNYGALDGSWAFKAYDSSNNLIDSTVVAPNYASNAGEFVAIESSSSNIAYATFTEVTGVDDWIFLDNVAYSTVPEPSNYAAYIFGAVAAFMAYRRSRKAQSVP